MYKLGTFFVIATCLIAPFSKYYPTGKFSPELQAAPTWAVFMYAVIVLLLLANILFKK